MSTVSTVNASRFFPLPLAGVRVLELAEGWAGPMSGMWLADLGAEVIKVEAIQRYDHARGPIVAPEGLASYPNKKPGSRPYNVASSYVQANRNKMAITIDLSRPAGVTLFKRLVAVADVVITNMVTGVPEKMGIGYHDLIKVRPDLIVLLSSGYGASGPYARRVTMGGAMDGIAGYTWLRHYADETPDTATYSMHTDVVTSMNNALAVQMAIYRRLHTGRGMLIETSGVEASLHQIPKALMDYALNGRVRTSLGNGHPFMAPHACYPCRPSTGSGQADEWINITVCSDAQWLALCHEMGDPSTDSKLALSQSKGQGPALAQDPRFASPSTRWVNQQELNERISAWTRQHDKMELMHQLQKAGIPAGAVYNQRDMAADPQWKARGVYQKVRLPDIGEYPLPTPAWIMDGRRLGARRPPPAVAEHNNYVFKEVMALSPGEVERLRAEQYIGDEPLMAASSGPLGNPNLAATRKA